MGKKNKNKSMGAVPSSFYEMNVDQVVLEEESAPTDEELLEQAKNIGVNTIGDELSKSDADLGVIDVVKEEEKKDDALSQKQKQQKGGYNGWWWWKK